MKVRPAAVAGSFYEGREHALRLSVSRLLERAARDGEQEAPKVLIVPHAGHIYSGATAAAAYQRLRPVVSAISRVVLLGPAHRVYVQGLAVPTVQAFDTPLGPVLLDSEAIRRALQLPDVIASDEAHALEHSLEVQLPFLQASLEEFRLLPLVVGDAGPERVAAVIDAFWGGDETLVVVSTDLSHFHDYDTAVRHDETTCERILNGDSDLKGTDACGAAAVNGLMASRHGAALRRELVAHCNSGDTAGDRNRVVGYGAFALY